MKLEEFNTLENSDACESMLRCCGASDWARAMVHARPFHHIGQVIEMADLFWEHATEEDVLKAFSAHPKIGDKKNLVEKFATTAKWAGTEQKGVESASEIIIDRLAENNKQYQEKFDFIFIVCATGKSAEEMLELLEERLQNKQEIEFLIAKEEQRKITHIRLKKLFA